MKRTGAILTALALSISLTACGGSKDGQATNEPAATAEEKTGPTATELEPQLVGTTLDKAIELSKTSSEKIGYATADRSSVSGELSDWTVVKLDFTGSSPTMIVERTTPEVKTIETVALGSPVILTDADITVQSVSQETELPGNAEQITAGDGTLFLITMDWTNKSNEAVTKKCWGPYTVDMKVYDTQNREMLLSHESGGIPGNDCTNGLMTGESGPWLAAYNGLADSEVGYIVFTDHQTGKEVPVLVDETLELTRGS